MNINKDNYESWFLDYHEGALTAEKVAELFLFLEKYPEFKSEFESFELITLSSSNEVYSLKDSLKKNTITSENYNDYLIAELEGDLKLQERVALKIFMDAHPELEKEKLLFSKTILQKEFVGYPAKEQLKKPAIATNRGYAVWMAAAAMILLLIAVYLMQPPEKQQVAVKKENRLQKTESNNMPESSNSPINLSETTSNNSKVENFAANSDTSSNKLQEVRNETNKNFASNVVKSKVHVKHSKKVKQINPENIFSSTNEELAMITSPRLESSLIINEEEKEPVKTNFQNTTIPLPPQKCSFNPLQLFEDVKTAAADKVNHITGDEILYPPAKPNQFNDEKLPFKSRMIKLLAWTIKKVSNDNVKLKTDFDFDGNLASYELSAGKFKVEKNF